MNQDIDGVSGENNESGNPFSNNDERMLDQIQIKFEDFAFL